MKKSLLFIAMLALGGLSNAQPLLDSLQLLFFMNGVIETHLRDKHIAGATVCVVKNGRTILAKSYGFSE